MLAERKSSMLLEDTVLTDAENQLYQPHRLFRVSSYVIR